MNGEKGLSHEKTDAFYKEIKEKISWRGIRHGQNRLYITGHVSCKGKNTSVRAHPMGNGGYCETLHIPQITAILKKGRPYIPSCKGYDSGRGVFLHR